MAVLLPLAVPVLALRDRLSGKKRPMWSERFLRPMPDLPSGGIWIQAVSVGEVEVARRLLGELADFDLPVIVSATTATGLALARKTLGDRAVVTPCPVDLPVPVKRFLDTAKPRALVLVETELWPEMLHQAGRRGIPVAVVNARLSERSFVRYRRVRVLLKSLLAPLALVLARDESDARKFIDLGVNEDCVRVGGNVKYDLLRDERPLSWAEGLSRWAGDRPIVVAGSTMEGEEEIVLNSLNHYAAGARRPFLILAPRHPERFTEVASLLESRGLKTVRRSRWEESSESSADVFLLDTIGELARSYRYGAVAFIGGSLVSTGGHNPLEAALWGVPVLTGPHVHNFAEIYREMTAAGAARVVADDQEFGVVLGDWLGSPEKAHRAGKAGFEVIEQNRGAAARTATALMEFLKRGNQSSESA